MAETKSKIIEQIFKEAGIKDGTKYFDKFDDKTEKYLKKYLKVVKLLNAV